MRNAAERKEEHVCQAFLCQENIPVKEEGQQSRQQRCKYDGMRKAAMSPEISIMYTQLERDHIRIRDHRAENAQQQEFPVLLLFLIAAADRKGSERMPEC